MQLTRHLPWLFLLTAVSLGRAAEPRPIPTLSGPVIDEARLLRPNEVAALESELQSYPPKLQLQIWVINSLEGEPIENLSIRAVEKWKLGTTKEDRGALLLIAVADRRMRIEVGQGLEGEIPDITSGRIIRQVLTPSFRSGDFYSGIRQAARALYGAAGGQVEASEMARAPVKRGARRDFSAIVFIVVGFLVLLSLLRPRGSRFGGGGFWGGGGGWSGGGGSWGGGGGSWGGGGGGFSGGGSSGNW